MKCMKQKQWVLRGKHKEGGYFYFNGFTYDTRWLDCDNIESARKFDRKSEAERMCVNLNAACKEHGWRCYRVVSA